jgi:gluconokinase
MSSVLDEVLEGFEPTAEVAPLMSATKRAVLLGIDIGTSGVRAALFDETGNEIPGASAQNLRDLSTQTGFAEMDADAAVQLVAQTIDDLLDKPIPQSSVARIELISISCFWHSLMGIDKAGHPTTPILGWADTRSVQITKELRERFDETEVHRRTGCRFHPSYWPAKLLWLRKERPESVAKTGRWLGFGEYLGLRLFGESHASVSMASATGLLDQRTCEWDEDFIRELDIPLDTLPELAGEHQTFKKLTDEFSLRWPQLSNAQLYPAIGDGAANNIGSGCHTKERAALMVGTSGAMRVLYASEPPDELPPALWCYRADRKRIAIGGALSDGGGLYHWLTGSLSFPIDDEELQRELDLTPPDSHGLIIMPFWAGERSTGWHPDARGAIVGLTTQTQPVDILRAAMEAVAYRFALILRALAPFAPNVSIFAAGNALRASPVWVQIIADVLNRPIFLGAMTEASMRGAALLALEAAGKIQSIEQFSIPVELVFEPDASRHARYQSGLERQEKFYRLLVDV